MECRSPSRDKNVLWRIKWGIEINGPAHTASMHVRFSRRRHKFIVFFIFHNYLNGKKKMGNRKSITWRQLPPTVCFAIELESFFFYVVRVCYGCPTPHWTSARIPDETDGTGSPQKYFRFTHTRIQNAELDIPDIFVYSKVRVSDNRPFLVPFTVNVTPSEQPLLPVLLYPARKKKKKKLSSSALFFCSLEAVVKARQWNPVWTIRWTREMFPAEWKLKKKNPTHWQAFLLLLPPFEKKKKKKRTDAQLAYSAPPLLNSSHLKTGGGPVLEQSNNRTIKTLHGFIRKTEKKKKLN